MVLSMCVGISRYLKPCPKAIKEKLNSFFLLSTCLLASLDSIPLELSISVPYILETNLEAKLIRPGNYNYSCISEAKIRWIWRIRSQPKPHPHSCLMGRIQIKLLNMMGFICSVTSIETWNQHNQIPFIIFVAVIIKAF